MDLLWYRVWVVVGISFILVFGNEVIKISKTDAVIGEVHHQRQRQIETEVKPFSGFMGRLMANKYLIGGDKVTQRVLETVDPNILFFAGHPNERAGVDEHERISWFVIPLFIFGLIKLRRKNIVFLWLAMSIIWAIRFTQIDDSALVGVIVWIWGVVGIGIYNLIKK